MFTELLAGKNKTKFYKYFIDLKQMIHYAAVFIYSLSISDAAVSSP